MEKLTFEEFLSEVNRIEAEIAADHNAECLSGYAPFLVDPIVWDRDVALEAYESGLTPQQAVKHAISFYESEY